MNVFPSNYFGVRLNGDPCKFNTCSGYLYNNQTVNVTVTRPNNYIDIFDLYYNGTGYIYFLGCQISSEYNTDNSCLSFEKDFFDENGWHKDDFCGCPSGSYTCSNGSIGSCDTVPNWWKYLDNTVTTKTTHTTHTTTASKSTRLRTTHTTTKTKTKPTTKPKTSTRKETTKVTSTQTPPTTTNGLQTTTSSSFPTLEQLSDDGVDIHNVTQVLNDTLHYSRQGKKLNSTQISQITTICEKSANLNGIKSQNSDQILQNIDYLLSAKDEEIQKDGDCQTRILKLMETMVQNTADPHIQYLDGLNLGFSSKKIDCRNISYDDGLIDRGNTFDILNTSSDALASTNLVYIPLTELCKTQEVSHIFFTIYRDRKLFTGRQAVQTYSNLFRKPILSSDDDPILPPPSKCSPQLAVTSDTAVISATILDTNGKSVNRVEKTDDYEIMAHLKFDVNHLLPPLHGKFLVSWWDVGKEQWIGDEPCQIDSISNGIITATCKHLTDFTVLVDGTLDDAIVCDSALMTTGYVVNGMSIVCLIFLTILSSLVYFKTNTTTKILFYIRGQIVTKGDLVLFAYYFILLLFYILFVFFSDQRKLGNNETACVSLASAMYFLFLSSIMLNFLQGIRTIYTFFPKLISSFFEVIVSAPGAMAIGIVVPFSLSLSLAVFDTSFFKRNDSFCWIRPDFLVYAIVIPLTILLINALVCTIFVIYKIFFGHRRKLSASEVNHYDADFWSKIWGIFIMQFSLGVPWVLQYFTIQWPGTSFWHYLFTIILGSQGTILLMIFFYRRQKLIIESRRSSGKSKSSSTVKRTI